MTKNKTAKRPSLEEEERERLVQEWIDDAKRHLNVEGRLADWEAFLEGALLPPDGILAPLAGDAIASIQQARRGIETGNIRAAVIHLLDMAFTTCQLLSLDSEPAVAQRENFLKSRPLGPAKVQSNAAARHKPIRDEFDAIMAEKPPPKKGPARLKLEERLIAKFGEDAPSMGTIIRATKTKRGG